MPLNVEGVIENFGSEDVDVYFPAGGIFINLDSTEIRKLIIDQYEIL